MERFAPGLGELVEAREVITPEDLETDYGLAGGHVYHAEPGLDQFFAWRPLNGYARYRLPFDGLYLAGSGAHPGGGDHGRARRQRGAAASSRRSPNLADASAHPHGPTVTWMPWWSDPGTAKVDPSVAHQSCAG